MSIRSRQILCMLLLSGIGMFSGCQHFAPPAQGLVTSEWVEQSYQRQDQVEVQWKNQGLSFLLYQQQQGQTLQMLALTLTGQQLFQLTFDGKKVQVQQRIDPMRLLPFDYVVRDILYATYPHFSQLQKSDVLIEQDHEQTHVLIQGRKVLQIRSQHTAIELKNLQVPYEMIISPINNTLEQNEEQQQHVQ